MKHNVFRIGGAVHASFIEHKAPFCRPHNPDGYTRTDNKITCPLCLEKLEAEIFTPLVDFSPTELNILEYLEKKYKPQSLSENERRLGRTN